MCHVQSMRCYASEVRENIPLFKERVDILHMPGEVAKIDDEKVSGDGYEPSLASEDVLKPLDDAPGGVQGIMLDDSILHLKGRPCAKRPNKMLCRLGTLKGQGS